MKKEKILLVFGASGALGKGAVHSFIEKDYSRIYLFGSSDEELPREDNITFIKNGDLSEEKSVEAAFEEVEAGEDALVFLFSTVGGFFGGKDITETDYQIFRKMFMMNMNTSFLIHRYFTKLARKTAGGSACYTSALTAQEPEPNKAAYGSSKAALSYFVESAALEGKESHISVNAVAPFIINTPANRSWMKDVDYDTLIQPEEIGDLVHSLFSHYHFVSGNIISLRTRFPLK